MDFQLFIVINDLYIKLMQKSLPCTLLSVTEIWFEKCSTCVKWNSSVSKLSCGVRQGGVMSPYCFAIFIDDIVHKVVSSGTGCYIGLVCFSVILYADDILLLAPSISSLQRLLSICEQELRL